MLSQHLKAGNLRRIARGVFASVPKHADAATWSVDRFLAASRLRPGGVIAYHSALELLGYGYTDSQDVQVASAGQPGVLKTADFTCRFVDPFRPFRARRFAARSTASAKSVTATTLECTIADLFDRPDLAGDVEELINSLDLVDAAGRSAPDSPAGRPWATPRPLARRAGGSSATPSAWGSAPRRSPPCAPSRPSRTATRWAPPSGLAASRRAGG